MELPQEIEVWYIIPSLRRKLAIAMKKEGLKQKQIASVLDITEPAVSQYLKNKRAMTVKFGTVLEKAIGLSAKNIAKNPSSLNFEMQKLLAEIKSKNILCDVHKKHCKLPENCTLCNNPK